MSVEADPVLRVVNLGKNFGGVRAVRNLNFEIEEGTIFGLIGPNGSGKTTVFNLITGNEKPTSGAIVFMGRSIVGLSPDKVVRLGIGRTFQSTRMLAYMSVLENVKVGFHSSLKAGVLGALLRYPAVAREERELTANAEAILAFVSNDLVKRVDEPARNLPYALQRQLDIARALAGGPRLLLLDEPTAGLTERESNHLMATMERIRAQGITIILIEHRLKIIMSVCNRIIVLNFGDKICEGGPQDVSQDVGVIEAYLGTGSTIRREREVLT